MREIDGTSNSEFIYGSTKIIICYGAIKHVGRGEKVFKITLTFKVPLVHGTHEEHVTSIAIYKCGAYICNKTKIRLK